MQAFLERCFCVTLKSITTYLLEIFADSDIFATVDDTVTPRSTRPPRCELAVSSPPEPSPPGADVGNQRQARSNPPRSGALTFVETLLRSLHEKIPENHQLEHQFRAAPCAQYRSFYGSRKPGRDLPAGNQMSGW